MKFLSPAASLPYVNTVVLFVFILWFAELPAQQCTLPSRIFLPTADEAILEQFGTAVDVDENYMVAGMPHNSSHQVYSGRVIVYKFGNGNQWLKIAELTPSDPAKYLNFGSRVAIQGNSIAVIGREYNDEGISREKLYIFEKSTGEEWSSSTESYVIAKPFGTHLEWHRFGEFDIRNNELVAIAYFGQQSVMEIYTKSLGVFSLIQTLNLPPNSPSFAGYEWNLAVGDDILAIATEQFEQADHSIGGAFIYTRTGGTYSNMPRVLRAAEQTSTTWMGFGVAITISNNTVFVQGIHESAGIYYQSFYVFEKPSGGWADDAQPLMLQSPGYVQINARLVANDEYIFSRGQDYHNIVGFKKPAGGWSSAASRFVLSNEAISEKSDIGRQLKLDGNHLIAGCPMRFSYVGVGRELIVDYFDPAGNWQASDITPQEIHHSTDINATDDFFGAVFSVYDNRLVITANGDDEHGIDAGVVYVFNTMDSQVEPDQKIFNPEQENYTGFGEALAIGDSIMFIGAPYKDSLDTNGSVAFFNIGKVYIYRLTANGWQYSSQITAPAIFPQVSFGRRVVWSKGYCAVTEFYEGDSERIGRVHIYKEDEATKKFSYLATLDPAVHQRSDFFGNSMVMNDSLLVIGTGHVAPDVRYRKNVYVFRKKGEWKDATEDARLFTSDMGWNDRFGTSVSMYGKYIVVGAPYSPGYEFPIPPGHIISGAAYVFKQPAAGWSGELTEIARLTPSDPMELGTFGTSVAIDHNDIFIGAPNKYAQYNVTDNFTNHDNALIPGKVYHFRKSPDSEWTGTHQELRQLQSFEPDALDGYGATMFVSDRYLYVSAMLDDTESGFRTGSVQTMMQLPVIDDPPPMVCIDQTPVKLFGFPKYGNWSGPGVQPLTGIFSPAVAGVGNHTITYERSGCETTVQIEVLSDEVLITQQSDDIQIKCVGTSVPIVLESNKEEANYHWYFKSTSDEPFLEIDSSKQSITADRPGYYQVVINRGVCPDFVRQFNVEDESPVVITIEPVPTLCDDNDWQLSALPEAGIWSGPSIAPDGIINAAGLQNGNYSARYQFVTPLGCLWKDSVVVTVDKLLHPVIHYDGALICGGRPVELTLSDVDERSAVTWYGPDGNEVPGQPNPAIVIDEPGTYWAAVSKFACALNTLSVEVGAVEDSLFVPNIFTPNDDNLNDYFEVRSNGIEDFNLSVFNRYGNVLFETTNLEFQWPAAHVASGVYFWSADYTTCWKKRKSMKGWVHVIR